MLNAFLAGALVIAYATVAIFFLRFWRDTRDRLFLLFAVAFAVFGVERILLFTLNTPEETRPFIYLVRLVGFALIIFAVIDKNRRRP
jgi:hypothetical protein